MIRTIVASNCSARSISLSLTTWLKPLNSPADEDFHDLIAERYERKATVVTNNLDFTEWGAPFPNKLMGAATLDRVKHGAYQLILDGKSSRTTRPLNHPIDHSIKLGNNRSRSKSFLTKMGGPIKCKLGGLIRVQIDTNNSATVLANIKSRKLICINRFP